MLPGLANDDENRVWRVNATVVDPSADPEDKESAGHFMRGLVQDLTPFGRPDFLVSGQVCVISLAAIVGRLGERWAQKSDIVHDYVLRLIEQFADEGSIHEWLSESDLIIAQPGVTNVVGQFNCLKVLQKTLFHFLGDSNTEDIIVHSVTRIADGEIFGAKLDVEQVIAEAAQSGDTPAPAAGQWSPFVTSTGRAVRVSCRLDPLILLKASSKIGFRIRRRVIEIASGQEIDPAIVADMSRSDLLNIDAASIERGLERLQSEGTGENMPILILPVSYRTLSYLPGMTVIMGLLDAVPAAYRPGLVCELVDFDIAPRAALSSIISQLRRHCAHVIGQSRPETRPDSNLEGASGIAYEVRPMTSDVEFVGWVRSLRPGGASKRSVLLFDLNGHRQMALAAALGVTHATIRSST